jgi:HSP20 family protein
MTMTRNADLPQRRRSPFDLFLGHEPLASFRRELEKLFEDFVPGHGDGFTGFSPRVDVSESDTAVKVRAELPGMKKEEIEVSLHGDYITLKGEKKSETKTEKEGVHLEERLHGVFERKIPVPVPIQADKVEAAYEQGVLTITLPKTVEVRASQRKIAVKGA